MKTVYTNTDAFFDLKYSVDKPGGYKICTINGTKAGIIIAHCILS